MYSKLFKLLIIIVLLSNNINLCIAQTDNLATKVLTKNYKNTGGKKWKSIKSVKYFFEGTINESTIMNLEIEKLETKRYYSTKFIFPDRNIIYHNIFNGEKGIRINPNSDIEKIPNDELYLMKEQSYINPEIHYSELGYKVSYLKKGKLDDIECDILQLINSQQDTFLNYYEIESGLLLQVVDYTSKSKTVYRDFKQHEGLTLPARMEIITSEGAVSEFYLKKIELNAKIDESIFEF
ncbi:hypothetical protein [Chondrinema litorale]|uniref:hypothetical protein n=1 Tax=Chondrinema litorale TaxID=2994555 RepID=UPI00254361B2|nr:hypothetical protein [Chondrinema litorale]UZR96995.1 hypothetical protein OQ292_23130 [Chondrinema litorale]